VCEEGHLPMDKNKGVFATATESSEEDDDDDDDDDSDDDEDDFLLARRHRLRDDEVNKPKKGFFDLIYFHIHLGSRFRR
jgi:hypothetical protein